MVIKKCEECGKEFSAVTEQDCLVQLAIHKNKDCKGKPKAEPKKEIVKEDEKVVEEKPVEKKPKKAKSKPKKK